MRRTSSVAIAVAVVGLASCSDDGPGRSVPVDPVAPTTDLAAMQLPLQLDVVVEGLSGPTQIAPDGSGGFVLAELNGAEGAATGRILHFSSFDAEPDVLIDGLLTPTGVAVDGDRLWVMEQRRLTVGPLADPADRTVVLDELPFNGRSEGTISAVPGGGILFDTSGRRERDRLAAGSGSLFYLSGPDADPVEFATGFKHAYAQTPLGDGRWFVTEISDGQLDGGVPPDELLIVSEGDDFGYPRCIGDGDPVVAFEVPAAECALLPGSHALLPKGSTPTGVAIAPWDPDLVLVALWNTGRIVAVPVVAADQPLEPAVLVDAITHPQHLLADGDRVLVTDHTGGRILAIHP